VAFDPTALGLPRCPFLAATGLLCPGCGTLRALHALAGGHVAEALRLNPLAVLSLPLVGFYAASEISRMIRVRRFPSPRLPPWTGWLVLGLVVGFGVLRNLPLAPFTLLAPPTSLAEVTAPVSPSVGGAQRGRSRGPHPVPLDFASLRSGRTEPR
jgi:hypothetical protein